MTATQPAPNSPDKIADDWQTIACQRPTNGVDAWVAT